MNTELLGGALVEVLMLDETIEQVTVRQLSIRELRTYARSLEDDAALVELFAAKPKGWADTITPGSAIQILEAGHQINVGFLSQVVGLRTRVGQKLMPSVDPTKSELSPMPSPSSPSKPV